MVNYYTDSIKSAEKFRNRTGMSIKQFELLSKRFIPRFDNGHKPGRKTNLSAKEILFLLLVHNKKYYTQIELAYLFNTLQCRISHYISDYSKYLNESLQKYTKPHLASNSVSIDATERRTHSKLDNRKINYSGKKKTSLSRIK